LRSRSPRKKIIAFSLFDAGETVLGALVVSTFFPLYITKHVDVKLYSTLYALSLIFSFAFALIFGSFADRKALRKQFFISFSSITALCAVFITFFYEIPYVALFLFLFMLFSHQQAMVFYNSLLSALEERGLASGLGVASGYTASALALLLIAPRAEPSSVFALSGLLFFLLSLPSFILLDNPPWRGDVSVLGLLRDARFLIFLLSYFSLTEVANTLVAMMGVYLREVYGFSEREIYRVIGLSAFGGVAGGVLWGLLMERVSPRFLLLLAFPGWVSFLILVFLSGRDEVVYIGFLGGLLLSLVWSTGRVVLVESFPKESVSLRMSFLSLSERVASSGGLLLWSLFLLITGDDYKLSGLLLSVLPAFGALLYTLGFLRWK